MSSLVNPSFRLMSRSVSTGSSVDESISRLMIEHLYVFDIMPRIDRGAHGRNRYDQCMYEPTYATRPACENVVIDVDDIARLEIVRCSNFRCLMFNISGVCSAAVYIRVYRQHTGRIQARQLTYSRAYCELRSESSACDCDCEAARASDE